MFTEFNDVQFSGQCFGSADVCSGLVRVNLQLLLSKATTCPLLLCIQFLAHDVLAADNTTDRYGKT